MQTENENPPNSILREIRSSIDAIDDQLLPLFLQRMMAVKRIMIAKKICGIGTNDPKREDKILNRLTYAADSEMESWIRKFFTSVFSVSKDFQKTYHWGTLQTRVLLCGIKHSGKTTMGKLLAEILNVPFYDTDDLFSQKTGVPPRVFYREHGETLFQTEEAKILQSLEDLCPSPSVIALGGGSLSNPFFPPYLLHDTGSIVWLKVKDEIAFQRILATGLPPFLEHEKEPFVYFKSMNVERNRYYAASASITLEIGDNENIVDGVIRLLNMFPEKVLQRSND